MAEAAVAVVAQQAQTHPSWSLLRRVVFRFVCCYWVLYALPDTGRVSIAYVIPGAAFVLKPYVNFCHAVIPWVATHLFHVTGRAATYFPTGSGDTTLDYVQNFLFLAVSLAATILWSILDRHRPDYRTLYNWLHLLVRYTLAFTLFSYGFAKIFPLQFQPPYFNRLVEPYGEFSPMGVLWSFMGASMAYTIFAGAAEAAGGLLLLFRKTTSLGAMVSFTVLLNVVMLNFCYDVPVKLYSTNLLLMAAFLAAPDLRRLTNVLVLNRAAAPAEAIGPRFERRRWRIAATAFWVLFVGYELYGKIHGGWQGYQEFYVKPNRPPLYGLYDVESGPENWQKVIVSFPQGISVRTSDGKTLSLAAQYEAGAVTLTKRAGADMPLQFAYGVRFTWSRPDPDHVVLEGANGAAISIRLRKIDTSKFLLLSRGFHWINEVPMNR